MQAIIETLFDLVYLVTVITVCLLYTSDAADD